MDVKVTIQGLSDIDAAFRELPIQFERLALREGLKAGAEVYRDGMSRRAPERTGALTSGITFKVTVTPTKGAVARIGPQKDAFYGSFLERGTRKMRARPFMVRTMTEDGQIAISAFVNGVRRVFERLIRRARRRP